MNYRHIMAIAAVCFAMACHSHTIPAKESYANTLQQTTDGHQMLLGHCSLQMLQTAPFAAWYDTTYQHYQPDEAAIEQLKQQPLANLSVEVFLGTWCGDSRREVPRLVKVMQLAGFDTSQLKLIFVDRIAEAYKQSPQHEERGKFVHHVPAIIICKKGKELNRIVESPIISLEKDLLAIITGAPYSPKYKAISYWHKQVKQPDILMDSVQLQQLAGRLQPLCANASELNTLGYYLLWQHAHEAAFNVFSINTLLYPTSPNTWDSLAEAYAVTGDKEKAKYYYRKKLMLQPGDEATLKKLAAL